MGEEVEDFTMVAKANTVKQEEAQELTMASSKCLLLDQLRDAKKTVSTLNKMKNGRYKLRGKHTFDYDCFEDAHAGLISFGAKRMAKQDEEDWIKFLAEDRKDGDLLDEKILMVFTYTRYMYV